MRPNELLSSLNWCSVPIVSANETWALAPIDKAAVLLVGVASSVLCLALCCVFACLKYISAFASADPIDTKAAESTTAAAKSTSTRGGEQRVDVDGRVGLHSNCARARRRDMQVADDHVSASKARNEPEISAPSKEPEAGQMSDTDRVRNQLNTVAHQDGSTGRVAALQLQDNQMFSIANENLALIEIAVL
jgi:hypothetical protein